ncbi:MAG: aminotransferase class III-fold pyridoxal phosphate-dependent enzyme, partial [Deltaproteobacteria bacterium]|nr:aminotransferase class III-fold pyridoxal phosphate-dependent enzyme [Deltaproteobacteria bacterium]
MNFSHSQKAYELAQKFIPGGVNSPVRNFSQTGLPHPIFIDRGKGSRIWDIDGNEYIDYVNSWGASILGHAQTNVVNAVCEAVQKGLSFGAPTEAETRLAALIREAYPSVEKVRLVNSGTEAVMSALRLARAVTGRNTILKFEGCYHGHADALLVKAGSGLLAQSEATSAGIPPSLSKDTLVAPYNDLERLKK